VSARASVVVASFNQPRSLALVLGGVQALAAAPAELLVADDGSDPDTAALVERFAAGAPFPVRFLTQEHRGFGKTRALNHALREIAGEHVCFLDGDTVPHRAWLAEHARALAAGAAYATGGYVFLDVPQAEALERGESPERFLTAETLRRLRAVHLRNRWHRLLRTPDKPKILGGNWSARREALYRVNGFDERYAGRGKEDSDIRNRLNAAGLRGASLWDRAFVFHCPHELDPRRLDPARTRGPSDRAYYEARKRRPRCEHGIVHDPGAG
jgi:glycosyltransferase involved in cell wall biosynthesis